MIHNRKKLIKLDRHNARFREYIGQLKHTDKYFRTYDAQHESELSVARADNLNSMIHSFRSSKQSKTFCITKIDRHESNQGRY